VFRVEFFCEDKEVGEALRGLMGIALGIPKALPVTNAEITKTGRIKQQSGGNLPQMFVHYITSSKIDRITPAETRAWCKKQGTSPMSASYVLKNAVLMGALRKEGMSSKTVYFVIRALPKPTAKGK
jgi:hypothetical protein